MNVMCVVGNLGKDPEMRYTASGKAVCKFSLGVTTSKSGAKHTEWVDCVAWEKTAEIVSKYTSKGSKVGVQGHWQKSSWEHEGKKHYRVDCVVDRVFLLSSGQGQQSDPGGDDEPPPF